MNKLLLGGKWETPIDTTPSLINTPERVTIPKDDPLLKDEWIALSLPLKLTEITQTNFHLRFQKFRATRSLCRSRTGCMKWILNLKEWIRKNRKNPNHIELRKSHTTQRNGPKLTQNTKNKTKNLSILKYHLKRVKGISKILKITQTMIRKGALTQKSGEKLPKEIFCTQTVFLTQMWLTR